MWYKKGMQYVFSLFLVDFTLQPIVLLLSFAQNPSSYHAPYVIEVIL